MCFIASACETRVARLPMMSASSASPSKMVAGTSGRTMVPRTTRAIRLPAVAGSDARLMAAVVRGLDEHFGAIQSARRS